MLAGPRPRRLFCIPKQRSGFLEEVEPLGVPERSDRYRSTQKLATRQVDSL